MNKNETNRNLRRYPDSRSNRFNSDRLLLGQPQREAGSAKGDNKGVQEVEPMTNLKFIRTYFAANLHQQCIYQLEVENHAGVEPGTIQTALTVDDAISEEDLKAVVTVLKLL